MYAEFKNNVARRSQGYFNMKNYNKQSYITGKLIMSLNENTGNSARVITI